MVEPDNDSGEIRHRSSQESPSEDNGKPQDEAMEMTTKKPPMPKRIWDKLGLDPLTLTLMLKGALPPTISIAIYQSTGFAKTYSTIGYLVAIMSILSFAIMPRAKFVQTMTLNIIAVCIGCCIALLEIYCSVQARAHTTPKPASSSAGPSPGAQVSGYNSSASAVSAIWLFFNIYVVNTLRASRPQLQFPAIIYSIFTNVASTYAPQFPTMAKGIAFAERLLEAFLTGFGIAAGVSLLIFPISSRKVIFKQSAGFMGALQGTLKAQAVYLQSLEKSDMFGPSLNLQDKPEAKSKYSDDAKDKIAPRSAEAVALTKAVRGLGELYGKIAGDIAFAKREIAFGKLDAPDIDELIKLLRKIILPISGMSAVTDIFDRAAEKRGWNKLSSSESGEKPEEVIRKEQAKRQWNEVMRALHRPFEKMTAALSEGLQHASLTLELTETPKKKKGDKAAVAVGPDTDVEADGEQIKPGDKGFAAYLEKGIKEFYEERKVGLTTWCEANGIKLNSDVPEEYTADALQGTTSDGSLSQQQVLQRQLYLILYMEFLLWSTGRAVLDLVRFADEKVESGVMRKNRLILPGKKRIRKWIMNSLSVEDTTNDHLPDSTEVGASSVYLGESFKEKKDPEHLPPTNAWQRFGNKLRGLADLLGSQESAFGFRVACATLSIAIVAFLEDTQKFFIEQRLVWAMIMVSIGMTITAGSGVFGFLGRIAGTAIAMCTSFLIWYIVDGKTGGIIPLFFVFMFFEFYFVLKFPRFIVIALLSMVTQVLIIGYELQVRKVGVKIATSNGQPAYPIYLLAPYRLACVTGGMVVAFFWTFFPYPLTARSQLRKDLGSSLYLLANFYSCIHTTIGMRIRGDGGDPNDKTSPTTRLDKEQTKVFTKELALLAGLRQHSAFTAWEPTFGGKFPRKQYDVIIEEVSNILRYMALISYASQEFTPHHSMDPDQPQPSRTWLQDFARLLGTIKPTSQQTTSVLTLLASSVVNGHQLPPYLKAPDHYVLSQRLAALDKDILSISHVAEPGYAAFAVMQIASSLVSDDLGKLIKNVKELVGEVDFSFHIISSAESSDDSLAEHKGGKID